MRQIYENSTPSQLSCTMSPLVNHHSGKDMDGLTHFRTLAHYNSRLNQQIYETAASLSKPELDKERGAFFHSILGTLNHILVGDLLWMRRFHASGISRFSKLNKLNSFPNISALDQTLFEDFEQLMKARYEVDDILKDWINQDLEERDLEGVFTYQNSKGDNYTKNFGEVLSHVFNHQTHHRGQVSTLLNQLDLDIGSTDYILDI